MQEFAVVPLFAEAAEPVFADDGFFGLAVPVWAVGTAEAGAFQVVFAGAGSVCVGLGGDGWFVGGSQ